jgi:hypothetical protein
MGLSTETDKGVKVEARNMNPQFWLYWIGVVTVGYIIPLPGVIFKYDARKAAEKELKEAAE